MSLDLSVKSLENGGFVVLNDGPAPREPALGRPETGACGFRLELPSSGRLKAGVEVRAHVVGDVEDRRNSPLIVKP